MRTATVVIALIAGFVAPSLFADWQGQAVKGSLLDQLRMSYPRTVMDASGIKVARPGAVLVVQLDGLQANPMKADPFKNKFEDGHASAGARKLPVPMELPNNPFASKPRALAVNEQVYLLDMEAKGDALVLTVQTCGSCDPGAADSAKPYRASIAFNFYSGFLAATDLPHVQQAIGVLLAYAQTAAPVSAQPAVQAAQQDPAQDDGHPPLRHADGGQTQTQTPVGPAPQPVKFPDLTPPPPPPPPPPGPATPAQPPTLRRPDEVQAQQTADRQPSGQPVTDTPVPPRPPAPKTEIKTEAQPEAKPEIELRWTQAKVKAALGEPDKTEKSHGQEIYRYKQVNVTFEHGKVTAIGSTR